MNDSGIPLREGLATMASRGPKLQSRSKSGAKRRRGASRSRGRHRSGPPFPSHPAPHSSSLPAVLVTVAVWLSSTATLVFGPTHATQSWVVGETADSHVFAESPFSYEDEAETHRRRREAAEATAPVYRISKERIAESLERFDALRATVRSEEGGDTGIADTAPLPGPLAKTLQSLSQEDRRTLEYSLGDASRADVLKRLLEQELRGGVATREQLETAFDKTAVDGRISLMDPLLRTSKRDVRSLSSVSAATAHILQRHERIFARNVERQADVLRKVLPEVIVPNLVLDRSGTKKARDLAAERVPPVVRTVEEGTALIRPGQTVSALDVQLLRDHAEATKQARASAGLASDALFYGSLSALLVWITAHSLRIMVPQVARSAVQVSLIGTVIVLQLALNRLVAHAYLATWSTGNSGYYLFTMLPFALGPMLLVQLSGVRTAFVASAYLATVTCIQYDMSVQMLLASLSAGVVGAMLLQKARRRYHPIRAGLAAGAAVLVVGLLFLMQETLPAESLRTLVPRVSLLSLGAGVVTSTVASALLPLFEFGFGVTTDISLLEMSDLNHPLLKRMQIEAPGSYHHSLMVATLAEQAAEAIGANPLLARVCSYFHDVGKLQHPEYFTENSPGTDRHSELQPRMSTMVILNHVKEGIALAHRHNLKRPIREAIAQHHGTSLVYYFFHKNLQQKGGVASGKAPVNEDDAQYRYPGPRPQRREIVILSLADAAEAASRSLDKPTPHKITALINDIVLSRFRDGQFAEGDLTFQELDTVKETLIRSLGTMLHGRIKYPGGPHEDTPGKAVPDPAAGEPKPAGTDSASDSSPGGAGEPSDSGL